MASSIVYNMDCMEYMKSLPDKAFSLAVIDPPYGIGESGAKNHTRSCLATASAYTPFAGGRCRSPTDGIF